LLDCSGVTISAAGEDFQFGDNVYVEKLKGVRIPTAFRNGTLTGKYVEHNGCFQVGDGYEGAPKGELSLLSQTAEQYFQVKPRWL